MPARVVHLLLHVPRCAGTSAGEHFRAHLGEAFLIAPRWHNPLRLFLAERHAMRANDPRLARLKVVTGHSLGVSLKRHLAGAEIRESVLIREPVSQLVSLYNYRAARHRAGTGPRPPAFPEWYRAQRRNPISRFLLSHYFERRVPTLYALSSADRLAFLEARLRDFHFVAGHTRADELVAGTSRELGLPERASRRNVTRDPALTEAMLDPAFAARIRAENALDQALWERWKDRGWIWEGRNPAGAAPPLPGRDRLAYAASDAVTTLRRLRLR
jgi:hypothetical protein